eukprot:COSAG05_NODE_962_length_6414_cov_4.358353_1_plen_401_part_00
MPRVADRVAYKLHVEGQDSAGQYLWKRGTCTKTPTKLWPTWYEIALDTDGERIMVVITRDNYGIGAGGCWRYIDPPPLAPPAAAAAAGAATRTANAPNRNVTILGGDDQVAQNLATMSDRKLRGEQSSSYIGVSWDVTGHVPAWTARFAEKDRATVHLGRYHDESEAARAYDTEARRQQRGTRASGGAPGYSRGYYRLNFPTAEEQAAWSRRDSRVGAAIAAETETEAGQQRGVPSQENGDGHGDGEEDEVGTSTSTSTAPPVVAVRVGTTGEGKAMEVQPQPMLHKALIRCIQPSSDGRGQQLEEEDEDEDDQKRHLSRKRYYSRSSSVPSAVDTTRAPSRLQRGYGARSIKRGSRPTATATTTTCTGAWGYSRRCAHQVFEFVLKSQSCMVSKRCSSR